jgi:hypothetical protein
MTKLLYILCLPILFVACKQKPVGNALPGQGMITYTVSYPDSINYGMKMSFFPKSITLVFKDDKAVFIATGGLGTLQIVNLLDHKANKYTSLLIDAIRQNYGCRLTPEEIKQNEGPPYYEFKYVDDTRTIAGVACKKAIAYDLANHSSFDIYYDDKIRFYYSNSPFKDFSQLMLEYTHTINNLTMKLTAAEVDFTTPVDTALFNVKGNFQWVDQKAFYAYIAEL